MNLSISSFLSLLISTLLFNLQITNAKKECINLDVLITQKIEHLGFHRDLNWLIESRNLDSNRWLNASCKVALQWNVGIGMFVNPDQANDLKRLKKLDIYIDGDVDVEAPAHLGSSHVVYIFLNDTQLLKPAAVKLPIHLRYQRSLMGGHGKVILAKPNLLVNCLESTICQRERKITAPNCSEEPVTFIAWNNVNYQALFEQTELLVPVGNLDDYGYVAIITCILGCAGCIYILSILSS